MFSESNKKLVTYFIIFLAVVVISYLIYYFFFTCKSGHVKFGGKCQPIVKQDNPTREGGIDTDKLGMLIDGKYNTSANQFTNDVKFNLNINGGSKPLKGLKVVAVAKKESSTTPVEVKLLENASATTPIATLKFDQNGNKHVREATFTPVTTSSVVLSVPSNMIVYEVQLI